MKIEELSDHVVSAITQNLGYSNDDDFWGNNKLVKEATVQIEQMDEYELLERFLNWHGIIGYTGLIISAINSIREVTKK